MTEVSETSPTPEQDKIEFKKCIVALVGPPLVGKTAIGDELARISNFTFIDVDRVRIETFGPRSGMLEELPERFEMASSYVRAHNVAGYNNLKTSNAWSVLKEERPVILAATFSRKSWHLLLKRLAKETDSPLKVFYLQAPDTVIEQRIKEREQTNPGLIRSFKEYLSIRNRYRLIEGIDVIEIDTSQPFTQTVEQIIKSLDDLRIRE